MSQKVDNIGLGAQGHVRKSRNYRNEGFEGSPISKLESYKFQMKQNNTTELLSISSHKCTIKMALKSNNNVENAGVSRFSGFLR